MTRFFSFSVILVFVLTSGTAIAADDEAPWHVLMLQADSLKRLLNVEPLSEKRKLELYKDIAQSYASNDQDSLLRYATKAIPLARKLKEYDILFGCYIHAGAAHCFRANYDSALTYFDQLKSIAIEVGNKRMETVVLSFYAYIYMIQGKYHTAIDLYLNVLKIHERKGNMEGCLAALINLSEINRKLSNTETALQYLERAEKIYYQLKSSNRWTMTSILNEFAFNYLNRGDLDMALRYATQSDSLNGDDYIVNLCNTKGILASIWLQRADYDLAMRYALQSYYWADRLQDKNLYAYAGKIVSDAYMAQKRYPEAEAAALKIWNTDSTYIDESRVAAGNIVLANIYMRQTERAAYYFKKYSELNELYAEKNFQTTVSDLAIKYETEKKEERIASLEKERRLYVWLGITGVVLALALGMILLQNQKNARKEKQLTATRSFLDGEMKERTRIAHDLHDRLSGSLSAVKFELSKHADTLTNIRDQLDKCIVDIRNTAHNLMPASLHYGMKVALEDFAKQFPNVHFHYFGAEKRIETRMEYVIYCCACELVNNAVKYSGAQNINLQLIQDRKHVSLTVSDDGCGFDKKTIAKGMGMKSIRNRVASCNGKIDIDSTPGKGTEITIELRMENGESRIENDEDIQIFIKNN